MATSRLEIDTHLGFGRGSAVRDYWLTRCQGFSAVRADGGRLGRVKRVETHPEGTFLRLTGFRARIVPLSAVDSVLPAASLLVISDEPLGDGTDDGLSPVRGERRPSWTDDTVPWWELVDAETAGARVHLNSDSRCVGARGAQFALRARRIPRLLASSIKRAEPFAKAFAARAPILVDRARNLAQTFVRNASRVNRATRQALKSGWMTAHSAVLAEIRRIRGGVARLLVRIAAWVGGSDAFAVAVCHDNQPVIDEPDTDEIDLGSGTS